jgi:hypothetical protein
VDSGIKKISWVADFFLFFSVPDVLVTGTPVANESAGGHPFGLIIRTFKFFGVRFRLRLSPIRRDRLSFEMPIRGRIILRHSRLRALKAENC